jgi:hypothetical protein
MKNIKIILSIFPLLFSSVSFALPLIGSPYFGAEGGFVNNNKANTVSIENNGGRVFVGYQFLFLALEGGYDRIQYYDKNNPTETSDHNYLKGYDASMKFILPLVCGLSTYANVGGIYLNQKGLPIAGVGIAYHFNSHVGIRLDLIHTMGNKTIPKTNFVPFGIFISI